MRRQLPLLFLVLWACTLTIYEIRHDWSVSQGATAVALADQQRHKVIEETRAASYSVFPDIEDANKLNDSSFLDALRKQSPNGSAFGVSADGLVMTNVHLIEGTNFCAGENTDNAMERRAKKQETYCLLMTQTSVKVFRAKLISMDEENDIAILRIEHPDGPLPYLTLAPTGSFSEGAEVLTIGSPLGNKNSMTLGFISNLDAMPEDEDSVQKTTRKIQFSAAILPGNSGGPLVAVATGEVVGQVVAVFAMPGMITQLSYANPVEYLRDNLSKVSPLKKD